MADNNEQDLAIKPETQTPVATPEIAPTPEQEPQTEAASEQPEMAAPTQEAEKNAPRKPLKKRGPVVIPQHRDEVTVKIEKILEEGVGDAYARLSPVAKQEFKMKGEEAARDIRELLKATHVKVKKILHIILEWLKLLPGVNKFFLEQEAKIKTDRIIALHKNKY